MKRMWLYIITVVIIVALGTVFVVFADDTDHTNTEFLNSFGWIVSNRAIEREKIRLPDGENAIYREYNRLQKEAGLDITPYYGMLAERHTYMVLNYPAPNMGEVRANVLCVNGRPIAGDIMTVRSDGFMHSLIFPQ